MIYPEIITSLMVLRDMLQKTGEENRFREVQAQIDFLWAAPSKHEYRPEKKQIWQGTGPNRGKQ